MDSGEFIEQCKTIVAEYTNKNIETENKVKIIPSDVFVVWSTKVLQNNKAMLSTPNSDGMYYEITYNGNKSELYFDAYKKKENICFKLDDK